MSVGETKTAGERMGEHGKDSRETGRAWERLGQLEREWESLRRTERDWESLGETRTAGRD